MANVTFGEWLKRRRGGLGLTQEQLARQIGCSTIMLRKIEAEERRPSEQIVERLAAAFDIAPAERKSFLKFARGDWQSAPPSIDDAAHWHAALAPPRSNLPATTTSLIGRAHDIQAVHGYLAQADIRLVTLIGPPGIGKTRLSLDVAHTALPHFPDGVFFVPLAPITDPILVAPTIVQTLKLPINQRSPLDGLKAGLNTRRILIVLDNFEQVIEAASLVVELLAVCPHLRMIVTSRESLRVPGEWLYPVPSLTIPNAMQLKTAAQQPLDQFSALTLFAERARAVQPDFALTPENAPTVAAICRKLDGLPLAIELIAARLRLMSPPVLLAHLTSNFTLHADGMRGVSWRQRSLHNTVAWSHDLLPREEQVLFARLAVFAGGFTLEAVEGICADDLLVPSTILNVLTQLIDRSLVTVERQGGYERYRMLETIREYALVKLQATGEFASLHARHLVFFLHLVESSEPQLRVGDETRLEEIASEHDNIRTALEWSLSCNEQLELALKLAGATCWFWNLRGMWSEAKKWLETLLPRTPSAPAPDRVKAQLQLAATIFNQSGPGKAQALMEDCLAFWRTLQDKWWISFALYQLGWVDLYERDLNAARFHFEECIDLARELHDDFLLGRGLHSLGGVLRRTNNVLAIPVLEEGLAIAQRSHDKGLMTQLLYHLGLAENVRGNIDGASERYNAGLTLARELGDYSGAAEILARLAVDVVLPRGDTDGAEALIWEGIELNVALGMDVEIAFDLAWLGYVAVTRGQFPRCAQLLGASEALFEKLGLSMSVWPHRARINQHHIDFTRAQLDEATFVQAWAAGRAMTREQVLELAYQA